MQSIVAIVLSCLAMSVSALYEGADLQYIAALTGDVSSAAATRKLMKPSSACKWTSIPGAEYCSVQPGYYLDVKPSTDYGKEMYSYYSFQDKCLSYTDMAKCNADTKSACSWAYTAGCITKYNPAGAYACKGSKVKTWYTCQAMADSAGCSKTSGCLWRADWLIPGGNCMPTWASKMTITEYTTWATAMYDEKMMSTNWGTCNSAKYYAEIMKCSKMTLTSCSGNCVAENGCGSTKKVCTLKESVMKKLLGEDKFLKALAGAGCCKKTTAATCK